MDHPEDQPLCLFCSTGCPGYIIIIWVSNLFIHTWNSKRPIWNWCSVKHFFLRNDFNHLIETTKKIVCLEFQVYNLSFLDLLAPVAWRMHRSTIRNLTWEERIHPPFDKGTSNHLPHRIDDMTGIHTGNFRDISSRPFLLSKDFWF